MYWIKLSLGRWIFIALCNQRTGINHHAAGMIRTACSQEIDDRAYLFAVERNWRKHDILCHAVKQIKKRNVKQYCKVCCLSERNCSFASFQTPIMQYGNTKSFGCFLLRKASCFPCGTDVASDGFVGDFHGITFAVGFAIDIW